MRRTAVFLDLDGTYVNDLGLVPLSAREAVTRARANGHLVFACTGRLPIELWPEILDVGFDGVIAASGDHIEIEGRVTSKPALPIEDVRAARTGNGRYPTKRCAGRSSRTCVPPWSTSTAWGSTTT